ncbi:MATE family efflux transporter [Clostridium botulinum]|uniref:Multidrug export protein MepA n=1 Tax=Clostridium botulinum (strain Hall / ATCC 3502 / NCTC 13319 / Type A) TaxID=441771 RepID=A5I5S5_CLOBH|nr:MATE family efflux transporter [Clostridium botulinum]ABS35368.1 MATE efflux family protein [Clostridium botulinum A str. ATCC 19397]ABS37543.1 MATE efflux family protein [Clostridium botulinum A str. Hall]AWB18631.1 MATE family efflux transporter [Clostridium botulinum]EGT5616615.1 MATE family efflux transporter [Clostridium botulinum]EGT5621121.1 MATE family efflux transporter [Clostridium botulinum]
MNKNREELINGNMFTLLLKLSIPGIIGMLVIGLYNLCDAIFVGKLVGETALAAVSISSPFTFINNCIAVLVGVGSSSILSRAIGAKDDKVVNEILANLILSVLVLSLTVTVLGCFFSENLLRFSGAKGEILQSGINYLRIVYIGSFFVNFSQSANMLIRGEGKMKEAMGIMALGAVLNIILDPIFIKTLNFGVEGAAIATVIAQIIQALVTFMYFKCNKSILSVTKLKFAFDLMPEILSVGGSAAMMQLMYLVQQTALYKLISIYGGDDQLVLMGVALRILMFTFIPIWGIGQGLQPIVGMNFGAKKYDRVKDAVKIFSIASTIFIGVLWGFYMLKPRVVLSWFINDRTIIENGYEFFRLMFLTFPVSGLIVMSMTFFQSIGKGGKSALITVLKQVILFMPIAIILTKIIGIKGTWLASSVTDAIVFVLSFVLLAIEFKKLYDINSSENQNITYIK